MGQTILRFEDLLVWQKAQDFCCFIYQLFQELKDYSFKDQIYRASVSVSSNIAERFERRTAKDFLRFLEIAKMPNNEVRSLLYLSSRLDYLNQGDMNKLIEQSEEISRMLSGLIKSIMEKNNLK